MCEFRTDKGGAVGTESLPRLLLNTASKTRSLAKLTGMIGQCGLGDGEGEGKK